MKKLTLSDMQQLAKSKGGKCLSKKYVHYKIKLKWRCKEGHVWEAALSHIKKGYWCPRCRMEPKRLKVVQEMQKIAKRRGGECLPEEYLYSGYKLRWKCAQGHLWEATPGHVNEGTWCPICAGRGRTIEDMQRLAKKRGGSCLSKKYINDKTKLRWQCSRSHIWEGEAGRVFRGSWCPVCAGKKKLTIEDMQDLAKKRGGQCLSTRYVNYHTKLNWQCEKGHVWEATPADLKSRGSWCPYCSLGPSSRSERVCRKFFETIFGNTFPKKRPKWLVTPEGKRMELDGYCQEKKLAFEYQGFQHYGEVKFFRALLSEREKYDQLKREKCKENDIVLIEVPYSVKYENMADFIIKYCLKNNVPIPRLTKEIDYRLFNIYSGEEMKEMREIARHRGGECLSDEYFNSQTKLKWKCAQGHEWEANPNNIKTGYWCPYCANNIRLSIKEMNVLAEKKGGRCLSREYVNNRTRLKWKCDKGHIWWATPSHIGRGQWCPICSRKKSPKLTSRTSSRPLVR